MSLKKKKFECFLEVNLINLKKSIRLINKQIKNYNFSIKKALLSKKKQQKHKINEITSHSHRLKNKLTKTTTKKPKENLIQNNNKENLLKRKKALLLFL